MGLTSKEGFIPTLFYQHVLTFKGVSSSDHTIVEYFSRLLYIPVNIDKSTQTGEYVLDTGVIGGISCGAMAAYFYNKFKDIQLPKALGFFGGRRFVPMVVVVASFFLSFIFAAIWPWIQYALIAIGQAISKNNSNAAIGAGIYGFVNRLLQPFGAHHIINTFLWFQLPVEGPLLAGLTPPANAIPDGNNYMIFGDINAFNAGIIGSGIFQAGFFPVFFGGIPATGLAMIFCAKKSKRKEVAVFLSGVAAVAFLTGIDEPIVFIWIFLSPLLLFIHAILTGLFAALIVGMGIRLGFGFSAGLIDYVISLPKSWDMAIQGTSTHSAQVLANPLWVLPISVIMGCIYFPIWTFIIKKMNIQTPGRSDTDDISGQTDITNSAFEDKKINLDIKKVSTKLSKKELQNQKYDTMAQGIVDLVGKENFKIIENCATRLRLVVKNNKLPIDDQLKKLGVYSVIRIGNEGLQLVIGTDVEHVTNRVRAIVGI